MNPAPPLHRLLPDDDQNPWTADDAAKTRTATALAEVAARQTGAPTCALCGQRVAQLDGFGLCSKVSGPHLEWRESVLRDERRKAPRWK